MSLISESNEQQKQAIIHEDGPQLIVAGAGTGKTRVVTARIAYLITEKNANVDEVLALTFTEKSAQEMEERVDQMLPYGYVDLWISTFHAFCDKILKRHALDIGLPNNYKLVDGTEAWLLVRKNLDKFKLEYYQPLGNPTKFIHALLKHFSRCKDEGIYPENYLKYAQEIKLNDDVHDFVNKIDFSKVDEANQKEILKQEILRIEEIANAYQTYQQILIDNESLDFADLINYTIQLFKKRPLILAKYRQQFKHILVDEFQDTNFVQYELIKLLATPKNNITVVGDDDQSIYKFRGASISNIMQFKKDYPTAKEVVLIENYRSTQEILDLAYNFILQNNPYRLEEKLGIDKKLKSNVSEKGEVVHYHLSSVEEEAKAVIQKIIKLKQDQQAEWSDIAILVRANDSANIFINYLEQAQIPYQFLAMRGLYNKSVVVDIINYFKLLDNYHESAAVYRILNLPFLNIEPEQIVKLVHLAKRKSISIFESLKQASTVPGLTEQTLKSINNILVQVEKDTQLAQNKKPTEVLLSFLYGSGYLEYLNDLEPAKAKETLDFVQQFFKKIQEVEMSYEDPRLSDLMELLNMEMQSGESGKLAFDVETGPDMVRIMTIHSAKGLEFDYVFVSCLVDRKFPTDQRKEVIEIPDSLIKEDSSEGDFHLEEERRLFYVAMTRAKRGLFFTSADDYGGARKKKLSRFLTELGYNKPEESGKAEPTVERVQKDDSKAFEYQLPRNFSYSQMQTYETCPLKYKFANVLKIPTFGNHYFSFGSTIHNTLQKFLEECFTVGLHTQQDIFAVGGSETGMSREPANQNRLLSLERLYEVYNENWQDDWYVNAKQKEEYLEKGKDLLKNFHQGFEKNKPKVKLLEQSFRLKIGEYTFVGRIDRVDELEKGQFEIIDYKTGQVKEKLSTEDRRQLMFYQIAAEEVLNIKLEKLTYYFLDDDSQVSFLGNSKDKEKLKQRFLDNIEQIKKQNFDPKPSQHICGHCDFKDICEFRKL
ncbi:UvrD-helicase domain-containing protein [Candidatus Falkowbacteria bacterium]|jgi:DNA helicase II / ATP-dependent DNA helicase PcrA|nr:UvrD-helicase domain-containing protein [Candidatus Falkowbacteria bacterium]MBT5503498.1 UvrD-helicase domain-containing protein [Candidatus Falkowbacteria bacterium]MBT6573970.1 UvrD-helicase domain-containing protein [Candidatus Falkowbacteria bacterium]MBT7348211.1 UvrD-helicase domain-containing protein [Candidatus Falkowbacteria bacterium]MBT7500190.1 UvrD-helicase domain-containing protein [Candidatus Falkowbacteria bacterium]